MAIDHRLYDLDLPAGVDLQGGGVPRDIEMITLTRREIMFLLSPIQDYNRRMAFVKVGRLSLLAPESVMEAAVGDNFYAICNAGGEIHVFSGLCPHRGGPLGQGAINGTRLSCPWHAWEFDCRTGKHDYNSEIKLASFPVQLSGDDILIDIP